MKSLTRWLFKKNEPCTESLGVPSSQELAILLDRVIFEWCNLSTVAAGRPVAGPARLELEYSVVLQGQCSCHLVLRTQKDLAAELAQAATGDPGARSDAEDAFRELCSQVAGRLVTETLGKKLSAFHGHLPLPSQPEQWPQRQPESESVVLVGPWPLEVRLWVEKAVTAQKGTPS